MRIGSIVQYKDFCDGVRTVKVTEVSDDIKNGKPGFVGVCLDANMQPIPSPYEEGPFMVWGYNSQVFLEIA
jgi:hypothetical protein